MYKQSLQLLGFLFTLLLVSCAKTVTESQPIPENVVKQKDLCPIIRSDKWHAWLDKYNQKEGSFRLNVSGELTLPNPAYHIEWTAGPIDRMYPPGLRLLLKPKKRDGMSIQVITDVPTSYQMDTPISRYRYVSIYCEGVELAKIENVVLTD